jgi:NCAIR mutase (PurE)-related protein
MNLEEIIKKYNEGYITISDFKKLISFSYVENIEDNIAKLDINREIRRGIPEIIYGEKKTFPDLLIILKRVLKKNNIVVISRVPKDYVRKIRTFCKKNTYYFENGKNSSTILLSKNQSIKTNESSKIGIFSAGTSDIGIAEEARLVSKAMGCNAITSYDVGIAGIHRIFLSLKQMINQNVHAIIVVAGMEGALASIVSSCVDVPVIGVPTSIGYGFGSDGIAALSSMLQSCSLGLTVVNIDNGIGAGAFASLIANRMCYKEK